MAGKSFFEILEDQIRREVTNEVRAEFETRYKGTAPATASSEPRSAPPLSPPASPPTSPTETWLLTHLDKMTFKAHASGAGQYQAQAKAFVSQSQPSTQRASEQKPLVYEPPRAKHSFSPEQIWAYGFFVRQGERLAENFDEKELKAAYRKLAFKLHPDQAQNEKAPAHFHSLTEAYQILSELF